MTTLRNLNVAYLDLYVIDCPEGSMFSDDAFVDTWYEMEKLVDNFLVKSIGVSNFNEALIKHLMNSARFGPAINQLECPPCYTQRTISNYCREKRIFIIGYNITASNTLIEDPMVIKKLNLSLGLELIHFENLLQIVDLAKKYSKTPEQILLRYQVDMGHIGLSQLQTKMQMKNNLEILKFELSKTDLMALEKLDRRTKIYV